jgi:hypothetical protein
MEKAVVMLGEEILVEGESSVFVSELGDWGVWCDRKAI